jgi:ubiquitin-protein ligase
VGGPYHTPEGNRVRLEFSSDYPKKCPTIEFMSIIHHMHLDKRHQPQQPFFDTLKKTYNKNYEIANLLEVSMPHIPPCSSQAFKKPLC